MNTKQIQILKCYDHFFRDGNPFWKDNTFKPHHLEMNYYVNFLGSTEFQLKLRIAPMAIEKKISLGILLIV